VYIYGDYKILDKAGHAVLYKQVGSQIAKVEGELDVPQIIRDVLKTRIRRLIICSKLFNLLLLH
jgi:hypothetical protein